MNKTILIALKESLLKAGKKLSPNSKAFQQYKATLSGLSVMQQQVAVGLILGDARIEMNKKCTGALLKFEWGDKNKEYAFHVYDLFSEYCITPPRQQTRINTCGNRVTTWCFQTLTHPDFVPLATIFLADKKKVIPTGLITNYLTPIGLAYWFMDDGGIAGSHSHGIQLHTQGFTVDEVDCMCRELSHKFDIKCRRYLHKTKPVINISASSYVTFRSITDKYILNSMKAKLLPR